MSFESMQAHETQFLEVVRSKLMARRFRGTFFLRRDGPAVTVTIRRPFMETSIVNRLRVFNPRKTSDLVYILNP